MNCMSCGSPIRPEFKASIRNNVCPACGDPLMNDETQELLSEIKEAFIKMPNDPEGLAGWLLANYEMRKIGQADPVKMFYGDKNKKPLRYDQEGNLSKEDQLRKNPKLAQNKLQMFYQNAGIKQPKTREHYNEIARQIQSNGPNLDSMYDNQDDFGNEGLDPEYEKAALAAMNGSVDPNVIREIMRESNVDSELGEGFDIGFDNIPEEKNQARQIQRMERLRRQQEMRNSGSVGLIKRSS